MDKKISTLIFVSFFCFISLHAQEWMQIGNDIEGEDGGDYSGSTISINSDGTIVAIGAQYNNGDEMHSTCGHIRVYKNQSGIWEQIGSDIDGESDSDRFGYSVSISDDGSIVGISAPYAWPAGYVKIYENQSNEWVQIGNTIYAVDGPGISDLYGWSICLNSNGSVIAIGDIKNDIAGYNAGSVKIFENISGIWTQIGSDILGEVAVDQTGWSVSLNDDGSIVAIGAPYNENNGFASGHVRIFKNESGSWEQIGSDIEGESYSRSGFSVSLSSDGTIVAIGAYTHSEGGLNAGQVRVYQNISNTWVQFGLSIDGEAGGDKSGCSVSLNANGTKVAIGAIKNDGNGSSSGHVRVYQNNSGMWEQIGNDINGQNTADQSGWSVSLNSNGSVVAIGAPLNNTSGVDAGHVRIFGEPYNGIGDTESYNIQIYPNPTKRIITIDIAYYRIQNLKIYDMTGKIIIEKTDIQGNNTIDLSGLRSGIYYISIQTDEKLLTTKIVKE